MSNEFKKMSEEELLLSSGGKGGALASLGGGPVLTVRNAAAGFVPLKSEPSPDSAVIAQLKNGDVVQVVGGRFRAGEDGSGKKPITYTQVYVPSLKQSGWINSDCIG